MSFLGNILPPSITNHKKELPWAEFADSQGEMECQEADPCPFAPYGQSNPGTA